MADLELDRLRDWVAAGPIAVVVAERVSPRAPFTAYALDLDRGISTEFRDRALATLADYGAGLLPVPFEDNTQLAEHELGVADQDLLDPAVLDVLLAAARAQPQRDHEARPERLRMYAVASVTDEHSALLIRAQNPVRHLRPDHLTLRFLGGRLTHSDPLFVYDASFDLLVFDGAVGVRSQNALEILFMDPDRRDRETADALASAASFVQAADHATLSDAANRDSRYAAKLRRMFRSGVFETVDLAAVAKTIEDFNLELRMVDGKLAFPTRRSARWELIYVLEDAFVYGQATGRRYQAPAKRAWTRRSIDGVTVENGVVTSVHGPGSWSPRTAAEVLGDMRARRRVEYVARLDEGPSLVEIRPLGGSEVLWVPGDSPLTNRLIELEDGRGQPGGPADAE